MQKKHWITKRKSKIGLTANLLIVLLSMIFSITNVAISQDKFPTPAGNPKQLFYLQRTSNTNTIVYELNYKNGLLDEDEPVHVFWIRYNEKRTQFFICRISHIPPGNVIKPVERSFVIIKAFRLCRF